MTGQATLVTDATTREVDRQPREERWSALVFGVAVVVAVPLLLWFGRDHWFFIDDWWALTKDGLTKPGYLDDHNGHWITLLRLEYRLNFRLWGLRSYLPYQVPVALAHVGAAVLLWLLMRRLGTRGWIATACALPFLFFGTGRANAVFAFQFSQTGSVVCGLALFVLADHRRSITRRDWLVLGVGLLGLMTSGMFLAFLAGFALTTLLRRGVRVTAFYVVPLGVIYAAWYVRYADGATPMEMTGRAIRFGARMYWAVFEALGQGGVGAVLLVVAAYGLGLVVLRAYREGRWSEAALPVGLAVGWIMFASSTAATRANNELTAESHDADRYLYVSASLLLPLVAMGAETLARRRMLLGAAALVPLALGLPRNLDKLSHTDPIFGGNRQLVFAMAHSPLADEVPPATALVMGPFESPLTIGWLARQADAGRIPPPDGTDPVRDLTAVGALVLDQVASSGDPGTCPELPGPLSRTLQGGQSVEFAGTITVTVTDGAHESFPRQFVSRNGGAVRVLAGRVDLVVRPPLGPAARVCAP